MGPKEIFILLNYLIELKLNAYNIYREDKSMGVIVNFIFRTKN